MSCSGNMDGFDFSGLKSAVDQLQMEGRKLKQRMKDAKYPFGIDDLELIDGVYQKPDPVQVYLEFGVFLEKRMFESFGIPKHLIYPST